ncbi:MAG: hypothetical protein M1537_04840 [Nitrospirae bacterium]|nr:MAG: hypothetical protein D084_Lepto4C00316G0004 [Leptospirillum sp. Group IV 'UBA BS']MCL4485653.1 hypothetical protein [Nitrospirota bacterium]
MHPYFRSSVLTLSLAGILVAGLSGCAFNFGGQTIGGNDSGTPSASQAPSQANPPVNPASEALASGAPLGNTGPLGLAPLGNEQSPRSQLLNEGSLGYFLDHLFGGNNPRISQEFLPPPTYGTTTAGGVPGGLWPGNWWIEGQGGGYNLVHLP